MGGLVGPVKYLLSLSFFFVCLKVILSHVRQLIGSVDTHIGRIPFVTCQLHDCVNPSVDFDTITSKFCTRRI